MSVRAFLRSYGKSVRRRVYFGRGLGLRGQPESVVAFFAVVVTGMLWSQGYVAFALILALVFALPAVALAAFVEWTAFRIQAERQDKIFERHKLKKLSREYNRND